MNIISVLMKTNARVVYSNKWIEYDKVTDNWCVYERKPHAKITRTIIETPIQDSAIEFLLKEE
jgi:hypothetical protein